MVCLENLPDDILLNIFSYLKSYSLLNIIDTCWRFEKIGKDRSLWHTADFSDGKLSAGQILRRVIGCLHASTKKIHFQGHKSKLNCQHKWKTDILTPYLLEKIGIKCPNLDSFTLSEAVLDGRKLKIFHFKNVSRLKSLSMLNCEVLHTPVLVSEGSYFKNICGILPHLEYLEVNDCNWIHDYDLMVLSKLDFLKTLVLRNNIRIGTTMAYLAITFRFGFKSLEVLDMRGTSLQNTDIQSILQNTKLKKLCIGPIGFAKRVSDDVADGFGLVIPDPNRREEPKQQVVVINLGPNGPQWSHANDEDLDSMGLDWVKRRMNDKPQEENSEDDHYLIGKEGKVIKIGDDKNETMRTNSCSRGQKRKLEDDDSDTEEKYNKTLKKSSDDGESSCSDSCTIDTDGFVEYPKIVTGPIPDEGLSDIMIHSFKSHGINLESIVMAGCAVTDGGLHDLLRFVPSLNYIDVSNSFVTEEGIQTAQIFKPSCVIINNKDHSNDER